MYSFLNSKKNIIVKRGSKNINGLTTYGNVGTIRAYFRALSEQQAAINSLQYGKGFMILTDLKSDIKIGDKLVIDGKDYTIQALTNNDRFIGNIKYKKAILISSL